MDDRDKILSRLNDRKPEKEPVIYLSGKYPTVDELISIFTENLRAAGGSVLFAEKDALSATLIGHYPESGIVVNLSNKIPLNDQQKGNPGDLYQTGQIDVLVVDGLIGVAENGAVWIPENNLGKRHFPFITRKIMIILNKQDLVFDLSHAYRKIDLSLLQFGLWIAGPSKTADIEQSLVIGAQGAMQHTIIITG
jgi:L-lactate dehydrogenase complex protein LldG